MEVTDEAPEQRAHVPALAHHELTRDFRLEDVWTLPTPKRPEDFSRLVRRIASFDPARSSSCVVRTLFALRWKIGKLFGWDVRVSPRR